MFRIKTVLLSLLVTLIAVSSPHAHGTSPHALGTMVKTMPANAAEVASGLSAIAMNFSKPMRVTVVNIVRSADNQRQALTAGLPGRFSRSIDIAMQPLDAGNYSVNWPALSSQYWLFSRAIFIATNKL